MMSTSCCFSRLETAAAAAGAAEEKEVSVPHSPRRLWDVAAAEAEGGLGRVVATVGRKQQWENFENNCLRIFFVSLFSPSESFFF